MKKPMRTTRWRQKGKLKDIRKVNNSVRETKVLIIAVTTNMLSKISIKLLKTPALNLVGLRLLSRVPKNLRNNSLPSFRTK